MTRLKSSAAGGRRQRLLRIGVLLVWLGCLGWLVRTEIAPELFGGTLRGYSGLIGTDLLSSDRWMLIRSEGEPAGYSHHSMIVDEDAPVAERITLQSTLQLRMQLLGAEHGVRTHSVVYLDDWSRLTRFQFQGDVAGVSVRAAGGRRISDGRFDVTLSLGDSVQRSTIDIPDEAILHFPMGEPLARRLRPGRSLSVMTLDPATLRMTPLTIHALRDETLQVEGRSWPATVVETRVMGTTFQSWIDRQGEVLRVETPFGWTLERSTADEALAAMLPPGSAAPAEHTQDEPQQPRNGER